MGTVERQALVARLAADFPLFAASTIERWVARAFARYEGARATDRASLAGRAVRATLEELSREDVATSRELPVAPPIVPPARAQQRAQQWHRQHEQQHEDEDEEEWCAEHQHRPPRVRSGTAAARDQVERPGEQDAGPDGDERARDRPRQRPGPGLRRRPVVRAGRAELAVEEQA